MKIALLGATGNVGSRILTELLVRGHMVTAIVRDPAKLAAPPGLTMARGDAYDRDGLPALLTGHDAAISAINFKDSDPDLLGPSSIPATPHRSTAYPMPVGR